MQPRNETTRLLTDNSPLEHIEISPGDAKSSTQRDEKKSKSSSEKTTHYFSYVKNNAYSNVLQNYLNEIKEIPTTYSTVLEVLQKIQPELARAVEKTYEDDVKKYEVANYALTKAGLWGSSVLCCIGAMLTCCTPGFYPAAGLSLMWGGGVGAGATAVSRVDLRFYYYLKQDLELVNQTIQKIKHYLELETSSRLSGGAHTLFQQTSADVYPDAEPEPVCEYRI